MKKNTFNISMVVLISVIVLYSVICLAKYQNVRLTADSMLYFSIAQKYVSGDYQNAINGYWGPLLAWLLIPFLYGSVGDILSINILNLIFGVLTVLGVWILSSRFEISERIRCIILFSLLPIVLKFSLVQPMDFLLVCVLIFYLGIVFNRDYPKKITSGLACGTLGALAYLSKAYAFPFFIVHFFIMNIFHYLRTVSKEDRKRVLMNCIAGFVLFFVISGAWIMTISDKYGYFTFSTMRETNFNAPGPEVVGGGLEFGVPVFTEGFYEPPNETAFVIWEDPSYLRGKPWSALQSLTHFKHFIKLTMKNIAEGIKIYEAFSTLSIAIIIAYLLLLSSKSNGGIFANTALLYPLFTLVLFSGGYVLFHFEERYVWLGNVLILLMGGHVLTGLFERPFFDSNMKKNILLGFFVISFIITPSRFIVQAGGWNAETAMYHISTDLKEYNVKGNIASNREQVPVHDAWHKTFRLAYWLDSRYYGQRGEKTRSRDLIMEFDKYDIDYYFFWGEQENIPEILYRYREITEGEIPGLKVFSIKERKKFK